MTLSALRDVGALLELQADGILPPGVHNATVEELEAMFGGSPRRKAILLKLDVLIRLARRCGFVLEIYVDGSFVTGKPDPDDADIILTLSELPERPNPLTVGDRVRRVRALRRSSGGLLHVFPYPASDWKFADMLEFFCTRRPEDGGGEKGVVRLVEWLND